MGFHGIDMDTGFVRLIHAPNPVPRGGKSDTLAGLWGGGGSRDLLQLVVVMHNLFI